MDGIPSCGKKILVILKHSQAVRQVGSSMKSALIHALETVRYGSYSLRRTVNPLPLICRVAAVRFDSFTVHQIRLVRIMVITSDCLSDYGGSIPPRVAKLHRGGLLG